MADWTPSTGVPVMREDLHFEVAGNGSSVILTHGFGDKRASGTWDRQWSMLIRQHRVLRWDLLAHGQSQAPPEAEAYARDRVRSALGSMVARVGSPATLVGHSLGGYLSLRYTLEHPDDVSGLVLFATGPGFRSAASRSEWNLRARELLDPAMPVASCALLEQHDSRVMDNLDKIHVPVLLVVGARDKAYQAGMSYLHERLPRSELHVIDDGGHNVHARRPEAVNPLIEALLSPQALTDWPRARH
jgi:pimeloyl-ACP methyl ester carboxylesterase